MRRWLIAALLAVGVGCGNDATEACAQYCDSISLCPGRLGGSDGCYASVCDTISDDDPCLERIAEYYRCLDGLATSCSTAPRALDACEDLVKTCD